MTANPLVLTTRVGRPIVFWQDDCMSPMNLANAKDLQRQFPNENQAIFLSGPNPVYNCHGLTMASRRCGVYLFEYEQVLADDGFSRLNQNQRVNVGDLAVYVEDGDVTHTGLVVEIRSAIGFGGEVPWIWSKWGSGSEVLHSVGYCPYANNEIVYYRQKQWKP